MHFHFSLNFVYVYDGDNDSYTLLAKLTGNIEGDSFRSYEGDGWDSSGNIVSTTRDIFIKFQPNDSETKARFKIQFDRGKVKIYF